MATPALDDWLPGIVPGPCPQNIGQVDEETAPGPRQAGIG
jgi:hypothetical protein